MVADDSDSFDDQGMCLQATKSFKFQITSRETIDPKIQDTHTKISTNGDGIAYPPDKKDWFWCIVLFELYMKAPQMKESYASASGMYSKPFSHPLLEIEMFHVGDRHNYIH